MKDHIKTIIFVIVLLVIGYFLLPYVKINQKSSQQNQNNQAGSATQTFTSDNMGIRLTYNKDQDSDGKDDTAVKESGDKVYVYYTAGPVEQGQWVQKFSKDPGEPLTIAIQKQFLTNYPAKDCYALSLGDYYNSYQVAPPTLPANVEEAVIAYPKTTDPNAPYWQNSSKCPPVYSEANGISYFWMDKNHPNEYFYLSIGQYAIFADATGQKTWQDTLEVTK